MPGVVNDPHNLSLRRAIFELGKSRLCGEVQRRSLPLKLRDDDPVIGRFFPGTCFVQTLANDNLVLRFSGSGYAFTNLTRRLSFDASGTVEFDTDFLMDGATMYVYFRQKSTSASAFKVKLVEHPESLSAMGVSLGGVDAGMANALGAQILKGEIARGFTVIRSPRGDVEFGLGVVEKGQHPTAPYRVPEGRLLLANDRAEVHQDQRDFVGPFEVKDGAKMHLDLAVDGAPAVDVLVVSRGVGEIWLQTYTTQAATTPPPFPALLDEAVLAGAPFRRELPLSAGLYYVVLDNTATAGRTAPPSYAHDDRAALVSYALTLDE